MHDNVSVNEYESLVDVQLGFSRAAVASVSEDDIGEDDDYFDKNDDYESLPDDESSLYASIVTPTSESDTGSADLVTGSGALEYATEYACLTEATTGRPYDQTEQ